jgi:hypothetical protein
VRKYCRAGEVSDVSMAHMHCMLGTDTLSVYVKCTSFPLQWWLDDRIKMLRYMHIACIVIGLRTM